MSDNTRVIKEKVRERWNKRAGTFDRSPGHGIHSESERDAWIELLGGVLGDGSLDILDVGTGTGVLALMLAGMGHRVTGMDIAEKMLQQAQSKAKALDLAVDFRMGDAEELPFPDSSFDVVINRHVVWSLPRPERAMAEWKRVLRPGGKLVIIDGNSNKTKPWHKKALGYLLIMITERRNPWLNSNYGSMEQYLPMRQRQRPDADIQILRGLGLQVDQMKVDIRRRGTLLEHLKYGCVDTSNKFLLKAVKS